MAKKPTIAAQPDSAAPVASVVALVQAASQQAQKDANHAGHAALEEVLQALHTVRTKIDGAMQYADEPALAALIQLESLL